MTRMNLPHLDIVYPNDPAYTQFLQTLFSKEASLEEPSAIFFPKTQAEIEGFMRYAYQHAIPLTICGGGLSSLSVKTNRVCIALNQYYKRVEVNKDHDFEVHAQGGAKVSQLLNALKPFDRHIPVGVSMLPGMGLITRGGIGYLSRSEGLTLDQIKAVTLITATGETLVLDERCEQQDLWNAVRGAAPRFGVVSEVTLKSLAHSNVIVTRLVGELSILHSWLEQSEALPHHISASLVLGSQSINRLDPVFYGYIVDNKINEATTENLFHLSQLLCNGHEVHWQQMPEVISYVAMPDFDVPMTDKKMTAPGKLIAWGKSYLLKNQELKKCAEELIKHIQSAPNPFCRIDLQHIGGVMSHIDNGSVFCGREADWSIVVTGIWEETAPEATKNKIKEWVIHLLNAIHSSVCGVYSVEIRKDRPETENELKLAFGCHQDRLDKLIQQYDPKGLLNAYPL